MKYITNLMLVATMVISGAAFADPTASSGSLSGAFANTNSTAGAIGFIDQSSNTSIVEASDLSKSVPGVFAAGTTAGGSNPCVVSIGGGGSGSGFGFNFSSAYNDGECQIRESVRLMSAIVKGDDPQNQIFLREVTCQSTIYWDAMERTFAETDDMRFFCDNPRPENGIVKIRDRKHPVAHRVVKVQPVSVGYANNSTSNHNGFW
ncbi:MAG: hypothetical protein DRQ78_04145 [Epsilonproteobacteria bacterium]|nr:MAG: hypothetical protein DRQ78_04145 [Campylobacterota bacterium]